MDRDGVATALRTARARLRPADVGLAAGTRRRVPGLRREEVALLTGISVDYLVRLEQARGPRPSEQVLGALARALRLTPDERDHLFHLAGAEPPRHRNLVWRRFLGEPSRVSLSPEEDEISAAQAVADLRAAAARYPDDPDLKDLVAELREKSERFAALWDAHLVERRRSATKTIEHPAVGTLVLDCDALHLPDTDQRLIVYSAAPGTADADALALLRVIGVQELGTPST